MVEPPDLEALRRHVDTTLNRFLEDKAALARALCMPGEVIRALDDFLAAGGKRLRPLLCVLGWHAAAGDGPIAPVIQVGAALEMFHAFVLIHDDVMDNSATRRGQPTVHRALAARHAADRPRASAEHLGASAAILIGDLALTWSDELLHTAGLTPAQLCRVLPVIDRMRTEVMYGQYLDLAATGRPTADVARALTIIRYKTATYTVERPLHTGAALANATPATQAALSDYALPIGEAFQLRDDLLGVFGTPETTGKPCLDDLRDGKHTVLLAVAFQSADRDQEQLLRTLIGDPELGEDGAARIRKVLVDTGARATVENMITSRCDQAQRALDRGALPPSATTSLRHLACVATVRTT
ncbi:polyprenyl synthetase family protein [Streptomyces sp. NPDC086554]|uniref:polyprenyl synthetase family protein n=1 Tax=Streptomyces sp. NPDC086554 TaxID=3154864 RepID=UPI003440DBCC